MITKMFRFAKNKKARINKARFVPSERKSSIADDEAFRYPRATYVHENAYYSGPYLCHVVSRALGNIYAIVTVRLPVKGSLNASISRGGAKRA